MCYEAMQTCQVFTHLNVSNLHCEAFPQVISSNHSHCAESGEKESVFVFVDGCVFVREREKKEPVSIFVSR